MTTTTSSEKISLYDRMSLTFSVSIIVGMSDFLFLLSCKLMFCCKKKKSVIGTDVKNNRPSSNVYQFQTMFPSSHKLRDVPGFSLVHFPEAFQCRHASFTNMTSSLLQLTISTKLERKKPGQSKVK